MFSVRNNLKILKITESLKTQNIRKLNLGKTKQFPKFSKNYYYYNFSKHTKNVYIIFVHKNYILHNTLDKVRKIGNFFRKHRK